MNTPVLALDSLTVAYGGKPVLSAVTHTFPMAGVAAILGRSGAGKSTLLRAMNRLTDLIDGAQVGGRVLLHGENLLDSGVDADRLRRRIGMLFQRPVVFPTSIRKNVLFGLANTGRLDRTRSAAIVQDALTQAGLWPEVLERLDAPAATLSIGQQQRLCLARTLAAEPEVLLLDEPTSALDAAAAAGVDAAVAAFAATRLVLYVTHDEDWAMTEAAQVVRVEEGRLTVVRDRTSTELLEREPAVDLGKAARMAALMKQIEAPPPD